MASPSYGAHIQAHTQTRGIFGKSISLAQTRENNVPHRTAFVENGKSDSSVVLGRTSWKKLLAGSAPHLALTCHRVGSLAEDVIVLADELIVVQHVQLLAGADLLPTDAAREAVQMEHLVARFPHQVRRCDALPATAALGTVAPEIETEEENKKIR